MRRFERTCLLIAALVLAGCGPSTHDLIEDLADPETREAAHQNLLLAKDQAVEPLLEGLADPELAGSRAQLVEVLVSLMTRVDDARIPTALNELMVHDPDKQIRSRIAQRMGLYKRTEAADALFELLQDDDGDVRYEAILALGGLESRLDSLQLLALGEQAKTLVDDAHPGTRLEAMSRVEDVVHQWVVEARALAINAQMAEAESLYTVALDYFPQSRHTAYDLGRFYYDNGRVDEGLQVLRRYGMALDVPRFAVAPTIDGKLDDEVWSSAARADSSYKFLWGDNYAAPPADVPTSFYVGYTDESLFIGIHAYDDHPDSLVVSVTEADPTRDGDISGRGSRGTVDQVWADDCVELFFDTNLDRRSYVHFGINSLGVREDEVMDPTSGFDQIARWSWAGDARIAAHVGADFWSLEFQLNFGQKELPPPSSGTVWGFNLVRNYRGEQYNQWVRTYGSGLRPDNFGMLLYE